MCILALEDSVLFVYRDPMVYSFFLMDEISMVCRNEEKSRLHT